MSHLNNLLSLFNGAEIGGIIEIHRGYITGQHTLELLAVEQAGFSGIWNDFDAIVRPAVTANMTQLVRVDAAGDQECSPACNPSCHAKGARRCLASVVCRHIHHVHVEQLAHQAGIFPQGLKSSVVVVGFASVGRQKFAARVDLITYRRNEVLVAASPEKVQIGPAGLILTQQLLHMTAKFRLRLQSWRQLQIPGVAKALGDILVQLIDGRDANLGEHTLLRDRIGVWNVRVWPWKLLVWHGFLGSDILVGPTEALGRARRDAARLTPERGVALHLTMCMNQKIRTSDSMQAGGCADRRW